MVPKMETALKKQTSIRLSSESFRLLLITYTADSHHESPPATPGSDSYSDRSVRQTMILRWTPWRPERTMRRSLWRWLLSGKTWLWLRTGEEEVEGERVLWDFFIESRIDGRALKMTDPQRGGERRLPQHIQDLLGEGNAAYAMEQMDEAIEIMHEIIRIDATIYEAWVTLLRSRVNWAITLKRWGWRSLRRI